MIMIRNTIAYILYAFLILGLIGSAINGTLIAHAEWGTVGAVILWFTTLWFGPVAVSWFDGGFLVALIIIATYAIVFSLATWIKPRS